MTKQLDIFEKKTIIVDDLKKSKESKENELYYQIYNLQKILNKIEKIVNNKDITGIEAKLMIIDIFNEIKEGNDNK